MPRELDKEQTERFEVFIKEADNLFNQKKYSTARISYNRALSIRPNDNYAKNQSKQINDLLKKQIEGENFKKKIALADNSYKELLYNNAAKNYHEALEIYPNELYPKYKIEEIKGILERVSKDAGKIENYSYAMMLGETMFQKQFYEKSCAFYVHALDLKPGDNQATWKIGEVKQVMTKLSDQLMFDKLIASADKSFQKEMFHDAMNDYCAAADFIPEDKHVFGRINEITQKLSIADSYADLVAKADNQFDEKYPVKRFNEIEPILQQQRIPVEKQPVGDVQQQGAEIALLNKESEVGGVENEAELNKIYDQLIYQANELFGTQQYIDSRGLYHKALDMKPDENYPNQRIDEINRLLKAIRTSPLDREFQKYVDLADSTFRENQYAVSRGWYNRALGIKTNEKYPVTQLKEIENKIAERMAGQSGQQFENAVQKASAAFDAKNLNVARFWYKKALELHPDDADVKKRLAEIQQALK